MRFYIASVSGNLLKIGKNSLLSNTAHIIYDKKRGKMSSYHPYIYKGVITENCIIKGDNFLRFFSNNVEIPIEKVSGSEYIKLINNRENYSMTNFN